MALVSATLPRSETPVLSSSPRARRTRRSSWRDPRLAVGLVLVAGSVVGGATVLSEEDRTTEVLATHSLEMARSIERDDDLLDRLHEDTFTALLGGNWNGNPQETVDVTLLGRYYERFGDHAVSVARRVTYLVTGDFKDEAIRVR